VWISGCSEFLDQIIRKIPANIVQKLKALTIKWTNLEVFPKQFGTQNDLAMFGLLGNSVQRKNCLNALGWLLSLQTDVHKRLNPNRLHWNGRNLNTKNCILPNRRKNSCKKKGWKTGGKNERKNRRKKNKLKNKAEKQEKTSGKNRRKKQVEKQEEKQEEKTSGKKQEENKWKQ